jgi:ADP-ribose pyrophosphatase
MYVPKFVSFDYKINEYILILVSGRGLLGRWGPNHAGDPVVTRWAKTQQDTKHKVLEIILINRKDSGNLALPGGMIDPG